MYECAVWRFMMVNGYPRGLCLPVGESNRQEAAEAITIEQRNGSKWIRMRCNGYEIVDEASDTIYRLDVGVFPNMDWTWEGAVAARPREIGDVPVGGFEDNDEDVLWQGQVVEVDEGAGHLYVAIAGKPPIIGDFYVEPFDYLNALKKVFRSPGYQPAWNDLDSSLMASWKGSSGTVPRDDCGICDDNPSNDNSTCEQDCLEVWNGSATLDNCDVCDTNPENDDTTCEQDCNGIWSGDAVLDDCDVCDSDSSNDNTTCQPPCEAIQSIATGECYEPLRLNKIAAGANRACALREDGTVACWGRNITLGATTDWQEPTLPETSFIEIAVSFIGNRHCGLTCLASPFGLCVAQ